MDFGGRIVKALSGFYYVRTPDGRIVECRARGKFRKEHLSPLVGDEVECSREGGHGMIERVLPRRNAFVRPAVSNLDALVIFASETNPVTDPFLIDRVSAIAGNQGVPVLLCINKIDLSDCGRLYEIYTGAGFEVFRTSAVSGEGIEALAARIRGKTVAFTGNSGVGKSSVLKSLCGLSNALEGDVRLASGLSISYVPQETDGLSGGMRAFIQSNALDETLFKAILRNMDFEREQFEKDLGELSQGQKKKILLARSLCTPAHLYVWDEPLNYIDVLSRVQVEKLICGYGPTLLLVEHDKTFLNNVCTRENIEL